MHFDEIQISKGWDDETQTKNVPAEIGAGKVLGGGLCPSMAIPLPIWAQPACLQLQPFANLPSYLPACTHIPCLYSVHARWSQHVSFSIYLCLLVSLFVHFCPFVLIFSRYPVIKAKKYPAQKYFAEIYCVKDIFPRIITTLVVLFSSWSSFTFT